MGQLHEEASHEINWDEVNEKKQGADSKDKVKYNKRNDPLFVTKMAFEDEQEWQEMKCNCCKEFEHLYQSVTICPYAITDDRTYMYGTLYVSDS